MNSFFILILVIVSSLLVYSFWKLYKKEDSTYMPVWKNVQGSCGGILGITVLALTNKVCPEKVTLFLMGLIAVYTLYYVLKTFVSR